MESLGCKFVPPSQKTNSKSKFILSQHDFSAGQQALDIILIHLVCTKISGPGGHWSSSAKWWGRGKWARKSARKIAKDVLNFKMYSAVQRRLISLVGSYQHSINQLPINFRTCNIFQFLWNSQISLLLPNPTYLPKAVPIYNIIYIYILYYIIYILYYIILSYLLLYYIICFYIILYYSILYYIILYYIVFYYIIVNYIILYHINYTVFL